MIVGPTNNYVDRAHALAHLGRMITNIRLNNRTIRFGPPDLGPGEHVYLDSVGRYVVVTGASDLIH